jgi:hypothetical protein
MIEPNVALLATLTDRLDQPPVPEDVPNGDPATALAEDLQDQAEVPAPEIGSPASLSHTDPPWVDLTTVAQRRFQLKRLSALMQTPDQAWLIEGVLREGSLGVLYGAPSTYKTFLALALTLCVASGRDWCERPVQQGWAVYICAEGQAGLKRRAEAWQQVFGATDEVLVLEEPASLSDPTIVTELIDDIAWCFREAGVDDNPVLIVVDTLARCFEGDENTAKDMSRFIQGIDRIKRAYKCAVLVVHHEPYQGNKPRGSSALWGAVDTSFRLHRPNDTSPLVILENMKQKEDAQLPNIVLEAVPVDLNGGGSSLVLVKAEAATLTGAGAAVGSPVQLPAKQQAILDAVSSSGAEGATAKELEERTEIPRTTLDRHLTKLMAAKKLTQERDEKGAQRFWVGDTPPPADDV